MPSIYETLDRKLEKLQEDAGANGWVLHFVHGGHPKRYWSQTLAPISEAFHDALEVQRSLGHWKQVSIWRRTAEQQDWDSGHVASILLDEDSEEPELVVIGMEALRDALDQESMLEKVKNDSLSLPKPPPDRLELF
jgi:hypothetical protein